MENNKNESDSIPTRTSLNRYPVGLGLQPALRLDGGVGRYSDLQPAFGIDRRSQAGCDHQYPRRHPQGQSGREGLPGRWADGCTGTGADDYAGRSERP
ncbi:hypothetical protein D9M71_824230 [compost metagenome]